MERNLLYLLLVSLLQEHEVNYFPRVKLRVIFKRMEFRKRANVNSFIYFKLISKRFS